MTYLVLKTIPCDRHNNLHILQLGELRHRGVREYLWGHTARRKWDQDSSPGLTEDELLASSTHFCVFVTQNFPTVSHLSWALLLPLLPSLPTHKYERGWQNYPGVREKHSTGILCQEGLCRVGPVGPAYSQLLSCLLSPTPGFLQNWNQDSDEDQSKH